MTTEIYLLQTDGGPDEGLWVLDPSGAIWPPPKALPPLDPRAGTYHLISFVRTPENDDVVLRCGSYQWIPRLADA